MASPVTIVVEERTDEGIRERSLDSERTKTMTVWPWARRAGRRRDPRLPVGPRRRTFILIYLDDGNASIGAYWDQDNEESKKVGNVRCNDSDMAHIKERQ